MYQRFKAFCRDHQISVGTISGFAGFIAFTASAIVSNVGGYDYSGLPPRAQSIIGVILGGLVIVGRFATAFAMWLGRIPVIPQPIDVPSEFEMWIDRTPPVDGQADAALGGGES